MNAAWAWYRGRGRLTQWGVGALALLLLLMLLGALFGEEQDAREARPAATSAPAVGGDVSPAPAVAQLQATAAPTAPPTPAPTTSPSPPTPAPTAAPPGYDPDGVARVFREGRSFMPRAGAEKLQVTVDGALVTARVAPTLLNEADALTVAAQTALSAARAIYAAFREAQSVRVEVLAEFTSPTGQKTTEAAAWLQIGRETAAQFEYDGLKGRVTSDNKHLFCLADKYQIHPAVYAALRDKGCLRGAAKL